MAVARQTEAAFTRQVIRLAQLLGWRVAHFRPALDRRGRWRTSVQGDGAGFPDLVLVHRREKWPALALELKVGKNKVTPEQAEWIEDLRRAGVVAAVVTPDRWEWLESKLRGNS